MANSEVLPGTKISAAKAGEFYIGDTAPAGQALGDAWIDLSTTNNVNRPQFKNDVSAANHWEKNIGLRCIYQGKSIGSITTTVADTDVIAITGISLTLNSTLSFLVRAWVAVEDSNGSNNHSIGLKLNGTIVNSTANYIWRGTTGLGFKQQIELWLPYHTTVGSQGFCMGLKTNSPSMRLLGVSATIPTSITSITFTGALAAATGTLRIGEVEIWEMS